MCTLTYMLNDQDVVDDPRPDLEQDQPHSKYYGSIEDKLSNLTSHDYALFRIDNNNIFDRMKTALSGTTYPLTIICYRRERDGSSVMEALVSQHTGKQVWEKSIKY